MTHRDVPRITAVLGPTNTGKTHLAIERMLGHHSGMIGFPLRLLARENYDRVVARAGRSQVALITGEEKIIPARARYFLCTVESMPTNRSVEFLAIDEIQMAGDRERGHIFTQRLLSARGTVETMFLGSGTMRTLLEKLVPEVAFSGRPRLSSLAWAGPRKITRLPRRSAVVAFSANDVYTLAELVRRQRGGAAVVLGALSPRTRNAQVDLYQAGEVDFLIATDAIGMGLNMDIDHVAFAGDTKFDGRRPRRLDHQELAQIAGRAGRHMNDGTFGVTAGCAEFDAETITAIEQHRFESLRRIYWRNADLDFNTVRDLKRSLERAPSWPFLAPKRDAEDQAALVALSRDTALMQRADTPGRVRLLWDVCQVPDFRKTLTEPHTRLLTLLFGHLAGGAERLPQDWVARQVERLDRTNGDIDTLAGRISHVRTWTYITQRQDWITDPVHWRERARAIEDRLSDALHARLISRFVDRRAAILSRRLRDGDELTAAVKPDGTVTVEGHRVGRLAGLRFTPDAPDSRTPRPIVTATRRILPRELVRQAAEIRSAPDRTFRFGPRGAVLWNGERIATLARGRHPLEPAIEMDVPDLLPSADRDAVAQCLQDWLGSCRARLIPGLDRLRAAGETGPVRGIFFQLTEGPGLLPRRQVTPLLADLDATGRRTLSRAGVRFGTESVFMPGLLKPRAARFLALLWQVHHGQWHEDALVPPGRAAVVANRVMPAGLYSATGYVRIGGLAVRADILERLAAAARREPRDRPFAISQDMLSLLGVTRAAAGAVLADLGYVRTGGSDEHPMFRRPARRSRTRHRAARTRQDHSPFAVLATMGAAD